MPNRRRASHSAPSEAARPGLWLAASNGEPLASRDENRSRPLSDAEGVALLLEQLAEIQLQLAPESRLWPDLEILLARLSRYQSLL